MLMLGQWGVEQRAGVGALSDFGAEAQGRAPCILEDLNLEAIVSALHSENPLPEGPLLEQERRQELAHLIDRLPPRTAQIIRMLYLEEGTRSEVAQALGIARHTLSGAEKRAMTRLRELLGDTGDTGP